MRNYLRYFYVGLFEKLKSRREEGCRKKDLSEQKRKAMTSASPKKRRGFCLGKNLFTLRWR